MLCHLVPDREETQEGKQMKILVCSCDRNWDLWMPFHHCMEKYWNDHPEIIYKTETKDNPYYKTIKKDYLLTEIFLLKKNFMLLHCLTMLQQTHY